MIEDDEQVEAWYLLAYGFFKTQKFESARDCCETVKKLMIKFKIQDPELEAGTLEIWENLPKETTQE